jgi:hypothetical protein
MTPIPTGQHDQAASQFFFAKPARSEPLACSDSNIKLTADRGFIDSLLPCCVRFAPASHPANGNTRYRPARYGFDRAGVAPAGLH